MIQLVWAAATQRRVPPPPPFVMLKVKCGEAVVPVSEKNADAGRIENNLSVPR